MLKEQSMLVRSLSIRAENGWLVTYHYFNTFATHRGLFVTSLAKTGGNKMAAFTVVFSRCSFQTSILNKRDEKSSEKLLVSVVCSFPVDRVREVPSARFPFKRL